jgi:hypothetical protein
MFPSAVFKAAYLPRAAVETQRLSRIQDVVLNLLAADFEVEMVDRLRALVFLPDSRSTDPNSPIIDSFACAISASIALSSSVGSISYSSQSLEPTAMCFHAAPLSGTVVM